MEKKRVRASLSVKSAVSTGLKEEVLQRIFKQCLNEPDDITTELEKDRRTLEQRETILKDRLKGLDKAVEKEEAKLLEIEKRGTDKVRKGFEKLAAALQKQSKAATMRTYLAKWKSKKSTKTTFPPLTTHITININDNYPSTPTPTFSSHQQRSPHAVLAIMVDLSTGICSGTCLHRSPTPVQYMEYTKGPDTCLPFFLSLWGLEYFTTNVCVLVNMEDRDSPRFADVIGSIGGNGCVVFTPGELMAKIHGCYNCVVLSCSQSVLTGSLGESVVMYPHPYEGLEDAVLTVLDHVQFAVFGVRHAEEFLCFGLPPHFLSRLLPFPPIAYPTPRSLLTAAVHFLHETDFWSVESSQRDTICF